VPLVHPFYFLVARRDSNRDLRPFQCRDAVACTQMLAALARFGYQLGEERLNNPAPVEWEVDPTQLALVDTSDCVCDDLLLTTTRWPVSDDPELSRKYVARAYTDLEQELLDLWRTWLPVLGRDRVMLHPELRRLLPPGYENRYDMLYREEEGARYKKLRRYSDTDHRPVVRNERRTAAFLLRLPRLPHRDVGYLGIWSLDGTSTLVWSKLLRYVHADLLCEPGFVMAELVHAPIPERPTDYRWTSDWRAEILLRVPLDSTPEGSYATSAAL